MHVLMITFNLNGIDEAAYRGITDQVAPAFPGLPGLLGKIWLADEPGNTYGGVYVFGSRRTLDGYLDSAIVRGLKTNPHLVNVEVQVFDTIDAATQVTQGRLGLFVDDCAA